MPENNAVFLPRRSITKKAQMKEEHSYGTHVSVLGRRETPVTLMIPYIPVVNSPVLPVMPTSANSSGANAVKAPPPALNEELQHHIAENPRKRRCRMRLATDHCPQVPIPKASSSRYRMSLTKRSSLIGAQDPAPAVKASSLSS